MALTDQPYLPLYVDDWMNNSKLKLCSPGAHGLMISIMCLMHKSESYGIILLKQKYKQTDKQILNFASQIAKQTSFDLLDVQSYLNELFDEKVLFLDGDQLVCFRMVKDAKTSLERSKSGKKGGDQTKKFAQAKHQANNQANTGIENGIVIENVVIDKWPFENFWGAYGKKQDRAKCEKKWANLKDEEREAIMGHVPKYVLSTPDIQFRKHPATYLNNRSWENEIIYHAKQNGSGKIGTKQQQTIDTAKAVAELYGDVLGKGQSG